MSPLAIAMPLHENIVSVSTILGALATIVYTVGTFLLWNATRQSLALTRDQLRLTERTSRAAILDEVFRSHREIYMNLIPHNASLSSLWESRLRIMATAAKPGIHPDQRIAEEIFSSILINHVARLFSHFHNGLLDEAIWAGTREDIRGLFEVDVIRDRWPKVRAAHAPEFRDFIDSLVQ